MRNQLLSLVLLSACAAGAQSGLAGRVSAVRNGEVRMEYPSRDQVCGDGKDMIAFRTAFFARDIESWGGRWESSGCKPGNVRVSLTIEEGAVTQLRTQVGGKWRDTDLRVTDLGLVNAREASAYFFSIAEKLEGMSARSRPLMPAMLAAHAPTLQPLRAIANDDDRSARLRREAIHWIGLTGDASVVPELARLARNSDAGEKKSVSNAAIAALAELEGDVGIPALIELSRFTNASVRHDVVFWLGQTEDPRAVRRLKEVVSDRGEEDRVRKNAIFAMSQCEAIPTRDIVATYRDVESSSLKEQAIFALSQRGSSGTDALIDIAKHDSDKRLRGKALFWLAQSKDPRVSKLLTDILVK